MTSGKIARCDQGHIFCLLIAAIKDIRAVGLSVMSNSRRRLLFGFDPSDWLYLASGVALVALFAAVFVL